MDRVDDRVSSVESKVDSNYRELDQRIKDLANRQQLSQLGTGALQEDSVAMALADNSGQAGQPTQSWLQLSRDARREEQYWRYRKSLRVWPVPGPDYKRSLEDFLENKLQFSRADIIGFGDFVVEKYFDPRSKAANEVTVFFRTKGVRDAIKAAGPNLATYGRAAGIRLHMPGHMMANFKLLENLGYQMRTVNSDIRRVIKFDDEHLDLMMDVKINGTWKQVRPADALAAKRNNPAIANAGPEIMGNQGIADFFSSPATGANAVASRRQITGPANGSSGQPGGP